MLGAQPKEAVRGACRYGSAIAQEALERIAALFKIEAEISGHGPRRRHAVRQELSLAQLADLKDLLSVAFARISRKNSLAGAIRYRFSRWPALCRFTADGRLEMSNNVAERAIGRWRWTARITSLPARTRAVVGPPFVTLSSDRGPERPLSSGLFARRPRPPRRPPINRIEELLSWHWGDAQRTAVTA